MVTGATGFIGLALRQRLLDLGAEVHGVSRRKPAGKNGIRTQWSIADLAEDEAAHRVLSDIRPDVVFHLASHVSGDRSFAALGSTVRDTLLATVNLLTAACESGRPRVVIAGSMEECLPGDPDPVPGSPYAAAKTAVATYGRMFHALYNLPVVHLRVFMVYGPGPQDVTKLVPYVTNCLLRGEPPLLSGGRREIDWIFIDDVVDAFVAAAHAPNAVGTAIEVGSGEVVTVRALVEQLARLVDGEAAPQFGARAERPLEVRRVADLAPARELLGWTPTTSLHAGLLRTVEWFRDYTQQTER
ncbi:MAG TPA: NAD-dependent epimerase/dehydratase family protein [Jiangellaceae bacterium]|nr:NAD-dependent epimerase/dehydratase family protein [Jiangellaceae bacterium]